MARLNWTELSIDDLINIAEFISKDSVKYSQIQIRRIRERARILKTKPFLGRVVPEAKNEFIRELILGNYRIIYKIISEERIDILTVHHSAKLLRIDLL
jgi:toxin ParE1/3/4